MALKLEMLASLDAAGVTSGAADARRAISGLGTAADAAGEQVTAAYREQEQAARQAGAAASAAGARAQAGARRASTATRLATHEALNLSYQMNDIAVGLSSGQSPFIVMAQQGMQVSQIMGSRGLGQIIPALGASIMSLINPTTLLLAGITTVGYAASAVYSSMREDISDTDAAVERHAELIRRIEDAYDQASRGAKRYHTESKAVLEADRQDSVFALEKRLGALLTDLFETDAFDPYNLLPTYGEISTPYREAMKEIAAFRQAAKDGEADVVRFHERLGELAAQGGLTGRERESLTAVRKEIRTPGGALETAKNLLELERGIEDIGLRKQREALDAFLRRGRDRLQQLRQETEAYREAIALDASPENTSQLMARRLAELRALQEATRRGFAADSPEAWRLHDQAKAIADETIALERQKEAYERLNAAREFVKSENTEIDRLKLEIDLIGASNAERARRLALFEAEQEIRKRKLNTDGAEAEAVREAALVKAAASLRLVRDRAAEQLSRGHTDELERLRLETQLLGQSNSVRERALALLRAEQEIRRRGIETNGQLAQSIRANARELSAERAELNKVKRAWQEVERTGTSAIDSLIDGVASGDPLQGLEALVSDLTKSVLQLSAGNPIKNALYGLELPTLADTGGIGGFFQALFGGGMEAMTAANMNVQAATVMLNGGVFNSPYSALGGGGPLAAANSNVSPVSLAGGSVASQAWNFFSGKGLQDFQVAAILGHMKAESAFNPLAVGDAGHAFGLFQWNDRSGNLLDFLGGKGNLSNIGGQLQFAWHELMTTESRAMRNLLSSADLRGATAAFGGFERAKGFTWDNPEAIHNWTGRLQAAEQALNTFGGRVGSATENLSSFGGNLQRSATSLAEGANSLAGTATDFASQSGELSNSLTKGVQNLINSFPAAPAGGSGGGIAGWVLDLLGGGFAGGIGGGSQLAAVAAGATGLYDQGGHTGTGADSDVAGLVHANEFVFDAPAVRRIGIDNLEAIRRGSLPGYQDGGFVTSNPLPLPASVGTGSAQHAPGVGQTVTVRLVDGSGNEIEAKQSRTPDGLRLDVEIDKLVGGLIGNRGSRTSKALQGNFGLKRVVGGR